MMRYGKWWCHNLHKSYTKEIFQGGTEVSTNLLIHPPKTCPECNQWFMNHWTSKMVANIISTSEAVNLCLQLENTFFIREFALSGESHTIVLRGIKELFCVEIITYWWLVIPIKGHVTTKRQDTQSNNRLLTQQNELLRYLEHSLNSLWVVICKSAH